MYYCQFPECSYSTSTRSQIHYHHIVPKELGGSNHPSNRIWLCPTHHTHIYIPSSLVGHHSIVSPNSIILFGWRSSTKVRVLEYCTVDNSEHCFYEERIL